MADKEIDPELELAKMEWDLLPDDAPVQLSKGMIVAMMERIRVTEVLLRTVGMQILDLNLRVMIAEKGNKSE